MEVSEKVSRRPRFRRATLLGTALVVLAAAAVGWTVLFPPDKESSDEEVALYRGEIKVEFEYRPFILDVKGTVEVRRKGESGFVPLTPEVALGEGDSVRTGPDGQVDVLIDERTTFRLAPDSELAFLRLHRDPDEALKKNVKLDLSRGEVTSQVAAAKKGQPLPDGASYEVDTPIVVAGVRGTLFSVRTTQEETSIRVLLGTVRATSKTDETESWDVEEGTASNFTKVPGKRRDPGDLKIEGPRVILERRGEVSEGERRALEAFRAATVFVEAAAAEDEAGSEAAPEEGWREGPEGEIERLVHAALERFEKRDTRGLAKLVVKKKEHDLEFRFNQHPLARVEEELARRFALADWIDIAIVKRGKEPRVQIAFDAADSNQATVRVWVRARAYHAVKEEEMADEGFIIFRVVKKTDEWLVWTGQTYLQHWK